MMKLTRPMIYIDLEATGADATRDRIVEIGLVRRNLDGTLSERVDRINPGVHIPAEVVAVHGITNEALTGCPAFRDIAPELLDFMQGCDFAGFGVQRFDMPLLLEEFRRIGLPFSLEGRSVVDGLMIFHQKEPRDLTAAYKFFCGKELVGAHGAKADAIAAMEVLEGQLKKYTDLPQDPASLHQYCRKQQDSRFVDTQRKFFWKDGEAAINFGKHKGETLRDLVRTHRDYVEWMVQDGKFPQDAIDLCWKALRGEFPKKEIPTHAP